MLGILQQLIARFERVSSSCHAWMTLGSASKALMAKVDLTRVLAKCCMWLGYPTAKVQMSWWRLTISVGVHSCNAKTQGALAGASGRIRHSLLFRPNGYQRVMHHLKMKNARFPRNCSFGIFCEFLLAFRIQVRNPNYQKILLRTRLQVYTEREPTNCDSPLIQLVLIECLLVKRALPIDDFLIVCCKIADI